MHRLEVLVLALTLAITMVIAALAAAAAALLARKDGESLASAVLRAGKAFGATATLLTTVGVAMLSTMR